MRFFLFMFFTGIILSLGAQTDHVMIQTKRQPNHGWMTMPAKTVDLIPGYISVEDGRDDFTRYGTYKYLQTDATGFFHVKKIDGRWWMIDPNGHAGINMAVAVMPATHIQDNYDIINRNGFNASGSFLANESQTMDVYNRDNYVNFAYTRRPNFYLRYQFRRHNYYPTPNNIRGSYNHVLVLDPFFEQWCDSIAKADVLPYANERDLLGYFPDNEINFNQDQLRNLVVDLPEGDPSREAALDFAISKGLTLQQITSNTISETVRREFAAFLAEHYYRTVAAAIRRYDQNHLILGSRLHGRPRAIMGVVEASHKYMDVTSANFYDYFAPSDQIARPEWTQDKPILVGEFYIKDEGIFEGIQNGAGWYVTGQQHRGYYYQNACIDFLKDGNFIGWHYFRFDDDPDSNKGLVSHGPNPKEYTEMTRYMAQLNNQVYRLIDHFDNVNRRPDRAVDEAAIEASHDTYVYTSASNDSNLGNEPHMEVFYFWNANNRREAFLQFDISQYTHQLPMLKSARLELYCTESNQNNRALFAAGIRDNDWEETHLTGATRHTNNAWNKTENRLSFNRGNISSGILEFEVTNWLHNEVDNGIVSFKIFDTKETNAPVKLASKEHPDSEKHPRLVLSFWGEELHTAAQALRQEPLSINITAHNNIKINNPDNQFLHYQIINMTGQLLMQGPMTTNPINAGHLLPGMYVIRLTGNTLSAIKFLLQ